MGTPTLDTLFHQKIKEMPQIDRKEATEEQIAKARVRKFTPYFYTFPKGTELEIKSVEWATHEVDGKNSGNACLILTFVGEDNIVYPRGAFKKYRDKDNKIIQAKGTFTEKLRSYSGKSMGELEDYLKTLVGTKITATLTEWEVVDKNGDIQPRSINGWDFPKTRAKRTKKEDK